MELTGYSASAAVEELAATSNLGQNELPGKQADDLDR